MDNIEHCTILRCENNMPNVVMFIWVVTTESLVTYVIADILN